VLFPRVSADTFSINTDWMFLYSGCTAPLQGVQRRMGYKPLKERDFGQAEQFQDERLLGVNKEFARKGKRDYLQEGSRCWGSGSLGIKGNCKSHTELDLPKEMKRTTMRVHSRVNEKSMIEEVRDPSKQ